MPSRLLDLRELNRALLARQGLLKRRRIGVARALHAFGGLQSQEPRDPHVALWSRLDGFHSQRLHEAAQRREIVRGSYLRSTIHTVDARDFRAFRPLLQPVIDRELTAARWQAIGGDIDEARAESLARALMTQQPMSAQALGEALLPHFPKAEKAGLGCWARTRIALAMVPGEERWGYSRPPRFVPADQWLHGALVPGSVCELLLHGIAAIGPASTGDLRAWSGLRGIAAELETLRPQLNVFRDEAGRELFDLPDAPRPRGDTPAPVRFLPEYDNALLSHEDRARITPARHAAALTQTRNARRRRAVLVDGFVAAGWSCERDRDEARLEVRLFERVDADTRAAIESEAAALARFLEPDATAHRIQLTSKEART